MSTIWGKELGTLIPVSKDCSMSIVSSGEVTQQALERLVAYIDLIKPWFPVESFVAIPTDDQPEQEREGAADKGSGE